MSKATADPPAPKPKKISFYPHKDYMGCDPELFISNGEHVVGSEWVIPEKGLKRNTTDSAAVIRDGVQVEFNPRREICRAYLGGNLQTQFKILYEQLKKTGFKIDLSPVVRVPADELEKLSEKSRVLGCKPSANQYGNDSPPVLTPANFNLRSASGHIHISTTCSPDNLVPILDLFVGNTCVLIDRDPGQVERRKLYGRAGEYRKPSYGIEYRTLSNFWLRSYQLFTFVINLARSANSVVHNAAKGGYAADVDAYQFLKAGLDTKRLQEAINQNDYDLALENYELFRQFIITYVPSPDIYTATTDSVWPLWPTALRWWRYFVKMGIDHWFKEDPMTHWISLPDGHNHGWESFLVNTVRPQYLKAHTKDEQKTQKKEKA